MMSRPSISIIIPAFNEERYLADTLTHLCTAEAFLKARSDVAVEILLVDNESTDRTPQIAKEFGLRVVRERQHNIAKVRNRGARASRNELLVFIDADTIVPHDLLLRISDVMQDANCAGGAVDVVFDAKRARVRAYLNLWRWFAAMSGAALGACQFCRRDAFEKVGGYDETIYMGEDAEFVWRLGRVFRGTGATTRILRDIHVVASSRRWDNWPLWRTVLMTHPVVVFAFWRKRELWRGWYDRAPR